MFYSKYIKIITITLLLFVLSGISFYFFNQKNNIQAKQIANNDIAVKENIVKK